MNEIIKNPHIGKLIKLRVKECDLDMSRLTNYFKCSEKEIEEVFRSKCLETDKLLKWSKLLKYDFFRIYSQHLILYSPPSKSVNSPNSPKLDSFRKNIYTKEVIDYILELLETKEKTKQQIIDEYRIPKTTLNTWVAKYKKN